MAAHSLGSECVRLKQALFNVSDILMVFYVYHMTWQDLLRCFCVLQKSVANRMLDLIRYFEQSLSKGSGFDEEKPAFTWGTVEKETVAKTFLSLCTRVQDQLVTEARLVEMEAPVYILGQQCE